MNEKRPSNTVTIHVEEYAYLVRSHAFLQAILNGGEFERKGIINAIARYLDVKVDEE